MPPLGSADDAEDPPPLAAGQETPARCPDARPLRTQLQPVVDSLLRRYGETPELRSEIERRLGELAAGREADGSGSRNPRVALALARSIHAYMSGRARGS